MQQSPFSGLPGIGSIGSGSSSLPGVGGISNPISSPLSPSNVTAEDGESFSSMLSGAMNTVNTTMTGDRGPAAMTKALLNGRLENLHEMTIAGQKSEIMMKLTTSITGKLAQATTQLFQMQI